MAVAAAVWCTYQVWRFFFEPTALGPFPVATPGAVDLELRIGEVRLWFSGASPYVNTSTASYPPASMLLLWPICGWAGVGLAKGLYAAATGACLALLVRQIRVASAAADRREIAFVTLLPFAMYATGATIGNGQLVTLTLPLAIAALQLFCRDRPSLVGDLAGAACMLLALAKPHVTIPFCWLALFAPGRLRPGVLIGAGYAVLTVWACAYLPGSTVELVREWLGNASAISAGAANSLSHGNLEAWLAALGLERLGQPAALAALVGMGAWSYVNRHRDLWSLLAVAGIFTRIWIYHGWYDDLLLLPAMIVLFRDAKDRQRSVAVRRVAGVALGATLCVMIAPGGQYLLPEPWLRVFLNGQQAVWLIDLVILVRSSRAVGAGNR